MKQAWSTTPGNTLFLPWVIPWQTGRFYSCVLTDGAGTFAALNTTVYSTPVYVPNPEGVTLDTLGIELTTTGSNGSLARMAIYEFPSTMELGDLLLDSGSFAVDGSVPLGIVGASGLNFHLYQGWYHIAFAATGGTFRAATSNLANFARGMVTPLGTDSNNWFLRWTLSATEITDIVTNGFYNTLILDPTLFLTGQPQRVKVLLGI